MNLRNKINSLQFKITITLIGSIYLIVSFLVIYNAYLQKTKAYSQAELSIQAEGNKYLFEIKSKIEVYQNQVSSFTALMSSSKSPQSPVSLNREQVVSMMTNILYNNIDLQAVGVLWEPNSFDLRDQEYVNKPQHDGTGNFIPKCYRTNNSRIVVEADKQGYLQPYYLFPKRNQQNYVGEPIFAKQNNQINSDITLSSTINYRGIFYGTSWFELRITDIVRLVQDASFSNSAAEMQLLSSQGNIIAASGLQNIQDINIKDLESSPADVNRLLRAEYSTFEMDEKSLDWILPVKFWNTSNHWILRIRIPKSKIDAPIQSERNKLLLYALILSSLVFVLLDYVIRKFLAPIKYVEQALNNMVSGKLKQELHFLNSIELNGLLEKFNQLSTNIMSNVYFAQKLSLGELDSDFQPKSGDDELGIALLQMQEQIIQTRKAENERKKREGENDWSQHGLAQINEIIRQTPEKIDSLSSAVLKYIIKYLNCAQGAIFTKEDNKAAGTASFVLISAIAYDKERLLDKKISENDGLIHTCVKEQKTIYLTEIPEDYIEIGTGIGSSKPRSLLICPFINTNQVYGIIELASFNILKPYEIETIERIAAVIAAEIASIRIKENTNSLLEEANKISSEMLYREETLRTNIKDLETEIRELKNNNTAQLAILAAHESSVLIIEYDAQGVVREINEQFERQLGISREDIIGKQHRNNLLEKDLTEEQYNEFWAKLRKGEVQHTRFQYMVKNKKFWFQETFNPILNAQGNVEKVIKIATDITELKQQADELLEKSTRLTAHENELQESITLLSNYRETVHSSQSQLFSILNVLESIAAIAQFKENGKLIQINSTFEKLLHVEKYDIIGEDFRSVFDLNRIEYEQIWETIQQGNVFTRQKSYFESSKKTILSESFAPIKDEKGEIEKILFIGIDQSKNATDLRNSIERSTRLLNLAKVQKAEIKQFLVDNAQMANLLTQSQELITVLNNLITYVIYEPSGKIIDINAQMVSISGIQKKNLMGLSVHHFVEFANNTDPELFWIDAINGPISIESQLRLTDREIWLREYYYPVFNADKLERIIAVGYEITGMKKAEYELNKITSTVSEYQLTVQNLGEQLKQTLKYQEQHVRMETFYRESFSHIAIISEFDANGHILFTSKETAKVYKFLPKTKIHHSDYVEFSNYAEYQIVWQDLVSGKTIERFFYSEINQKFLQYHIPLIHGNHLQRVMVITQVAAI